MRLATWNVERVKPRGWKIAPAQRRRMAEVDADVWVLTETHVDHAPSAEHTAVFCPPFPERRPPGERWAAIWSRYPIQPINDPLPHPRGTVAALVETPAGHLLVYGCVIPWAHEKALQDGRPAKLWQAHLETIDRIDTELARLRRNHPQVPLVVAGDFNQDRDGSNWYGTPAARRRLTLLLDRHHLVCLTATEVVTTGDPTRSHLIDHVCASSELAPCASVLRWGKSDSDGFRLSDHPTAAVDFNPLLQLHT